jgi:hypothetical protein
MYSKYYYIGVTKDIEARKMQHFKLIKDEFYKARKGCILDTSSIYGYLASEIVDELTDVLFPNTIITWHYSISIIKVVSSKEEAADIENKLLLKHTRSKYCLNKAKYSTYCKNNKKDAILL